VHYFYILYSASADKFYVGHSEDVQQRLIYHNHPIEKRKYTVRGIRLNSPGLKPGAIEAN
jgi:predicted GIY-YIG superfamily endonuclease